MLPFENGGLIFRLFNEADVAAFAAYRSESEVARYQGWPLPFTEDRAQEMIRDMSEQGGVAKGAWVNVALCTTSPDGQAQLIGDVAVGLNGTGDIADVGFTIATNFQRQGFATRATQAVLTELQRHGVHTFMASVHPENLASLRVLSKLGFLHVRTDKGAYAHRDGTMVDDAVYKLVL
jgi:aminoglycoside 6'-N-acetyltransferase